MGPPNHHPAVVHPQQQFFPSQPLYVQDRPLQEVPNGHDLCPAGKTGKHTVSAQMCFQLNGSKQAKYFRLGRNAQESGIIRTPAFASATVADAAGHPDSRALAPLGLVVLLLILHQIPPPSPPPSHSPSVSLFFLLRTTKCCAFFFFKSCLNSFFPSFSSLF